MGRLVTDKKIEPCPWCGKDVKCYISGSYVEGWLAFVDCCDIDCNARGPNKRTKCRSNDEYIIETEAIEAWNKVVGKK